MPDLDHRVALAQGWFIENVGEGYPEWWMMPFEKPDFPKAIVTVSGYHPSTDIAQAMAFAEWAREKHGIYLTAENGKFGWAVWAENIDVPGQHGSAGVKNLAEAICEAVLAALNK